MYSDLSPLYLNFCIFFLTGSSSIDVLSWSFQLQTPSLCALPFSPALSPVLQLWPLLCDLYDISDSAHLFLLYFWLSCDLSLCLVSHASMRAHRSRRGWGPRLLNVYSNVFHQWCRARWTECNHMLFVFIRLWLPLFLLLLLYLCVFAIAHCFMKSFLWMPFSPPGCPFFLFLKSNHYGQLQVEK